MTIDIDTMALILQYLHTLLFDAPMMRFCWGPVPKAAQAVLSGSAGANGRSHSSGTTGNLPLI